MTTKTMKNIMMFGFIIAALFVGVTLVMSSSAFAANATPSVGIGNPGIGRPDFAGAGVGGIGQPGFAGIAGIGRPGVVNGFNFAPKTAPKPPVKPVINPLIPRSDFFFFDEEAGFAVD